MYQRLVQMIYENKRVDNYIEDYQKKLVANGRVQDKCERELSSLKMKNENSRQYLNDNLAKNIRTQEDIDKKTQDIIKKRQDHYKLFKVALETIMRRLKDYESDCDKKGVQIQKYQHLDKVAEEENLKILSLNDEIQEIDNQIKDLQKQYKEIV